MTMHLHSVRTDRTFKTMPLEMTHLTPFYPESDF